MTVLCSLGEDGGRDQQCGERWRQTESEGWGVVGREIHLRDLEGKGPTERYVCTSLLIEALKYQVFVKKFANFEPQKL